MTSPTDLRRRPRTPDGRHEQRHDIQALRALAVMSVVLYHLWPNRLGGGFVGVDVFFVISGFLITGHLVREVRGTGRLGLTRFWAARARRLLPASLLVLLVTAVAVLVWVPRNLWEQFLGEVAASAAYVQNWRLASDAVDYLAADNRPSPVQHFWSLSVEEQFYVALPLLVVLAIVLARRVPARPAVLVAGLLVVVTAASFVHSVTLTGSDPGTAYFSTFTRMWEFGIGGLVSFARPLGHEASGGARRFVAPAATLAGVAAIGLSYVLIDGSTAFPGYAAALPVAGTAAVLRWGGPTWFATIGRAQPVALLGRISYAMYLWHWPMIVLLPFITLHALTTTDKLGVLVASVAVAWASTTWFEEPLRFRLAPRVRPLPVLGAVVVAMVPVMAVAFTGRAVVAHDREQARAAVSAIERDRPDCFGAAAMGPDGCDNPALAGVVVPSATEAAADDANRTDCWSSHDSAALNICSVGPADGYSMRLMAVGDSHNNALISAYESIAQQRGWRIDIAGHVGCYWTTAELRQRNAEQQQLCETWQASLAKHLSTPGRYDAVIATHSTNVNVQPAAGRSREAATVDGLVEAWTSQVPAGTRVVGLVDNPRTRKTNADCVERDGEADPGRCATPRATALAKFDGTAQAVRRVPSAVLVDMTDYYCLADTCPSVIGGVNVYRDQTHLTDTYAQTLAPYLGEAIAAALRLPPDL